MSEVLLSSDDHHVLDRTISNVHGVKKGHLSISAPRGASFKLEKSMSSPLIATWFVSHGVKMIEWTRDMSSIRDQGDDFYILRCIIRGKMIVGLNSGTKTIHQNCGMISHSRFPYFARAYPDTEGVHEACHAFIPLHLLYNQISPSHLGQVLSCEDSDGFLTRNMLETISKHGDTLSVNLRDRCISLLLDTVKKIANPAIASARQPISISSSRFQEMKSFIHSHLGNTELCPKDIADAMGVSLRQICNIASAHNTTIRRLINQSRALSAAELLRRPDGHRIPLLEISRILGFRSPSEFSRIFRNEFGQSPSEFRSSPLS